MWIFQQEGATADVCLGFGSLNVCVCRSLRKLFSHQARASIFSPKRANGQTPIISLAGGVGRLHDRNVQRYFTGRGLVRLSRLSGFLVLPMVRRGVWVHVKYVTDLTQWPGSLESGAAVTLNFSCQ